MLVLGCQMHQAMEFKIDSDVIKARNELIKTSNKTKEVTKDFESNINKCCNPKGE